MRNVIPTEECPWCGGTKPNEWNRCAVCIESGYGEGTDAKFETPLPTAAGGTANARRLAAGESEASGEEARALTGGPVKLKQYVDRIAREARLGIDAKGKNNACAIRQRQLAIVWAELVNLSGQLDRREIEGPAVSTERTNPHPTGGSNHE